MVSLSIFTAVSPPFNSLTHFEKFGDWELGTRATWRKNSYQLCGLVQKPGHHHLSGKCVCVCVHPLTSWNSLRRSYAFCIPESSHRALMAGMYCRKTDCSSCPLVTLADRVSNAIMVSPCRLLSGSPHGMCSFSRASTNTRTPGEEVKGSRVREKEAQLWLLKNLAGQIRMNQRGRDTIRAAYQK